MSVLATFTDTPPLTRLDLEVRWPVLARAMIPEAAASAEACVAVRIQGRTEGERFAGILTATVIEGDPTSPVRPLLDAPATGVAMLLDGSPDGWMHVECATDEGVTCAVLFRAAASDCSDSDGREGARMSAYVCSNVLAHVGLRGGQYGPPGARAERF